jgi:molybdenum cofactor synthesis domain-containing protein
MNRTAAIVIIGNEILSGNTEDCNSIFLVKELRDLGVTVRHIEIISDVTDEIAETLRRLSSKYDYIFTSGGIGPTHDDVTIEGVAKAFGVRIVKAPELQEIVRERYKDESAKAAMKMSDVPEGAELITDHGLSFPLIAFRNIFIFPGIPSYLKTKFNAIKERFRECPFYSRIIHISQQEADIAAILEEAEKKCTPVMIGSYPIVGEDRPHVKVTIEAKEKEPVDDALEYIKNRIDPSRIIRVE